MQTPPPNTDPPMRINPDERPVSQEPACAPASERFQRTWDPDPLPKPRIDPSLELMNWPERSAEVLRHALLSVEYWLSRGGWLREWIRLNLWTGAVLIVVLSLIVVPPVTAILGGIRDWTGLLGATIGNINVAVATLPPIVLALATAFLAVKLIQRHRAIRRPQRRQEYIPYEYADTKSSPRQSPWRVSFLAVSRHSYVSACLTGIPTKISWQNRPEAYPRDQCFSLRTLLIAPSAGACEGFLTEIPPTGASKRLFRPILARYPLFPAPPMSDVSARGIPHPSKSFPF